MPAPSNPEFISLKSGIACIEDIDKTIKTIMSVASGKKAFAQLCSLKPICSARQAEIAFEHAHSAIAGKTAFAKSLEIEFLLRLAGTKKIDAALKILGLRNGEQEALLIICAEDKKTVNETEKEIKKSIKFGENAELLNTNLKRNFKYIQKTYGITDNELYALSNMRKEDALQQAVIEMVALVALED